MVFEVEISVSGGSRRDTRRSLRFLFLLYAIIGGCSKIVLHRSLACSIGCSSASFLWRSGRRGLYVVANIILFSRWRVCWCLLLSRSSLDSAAALRRPSLIKPGLYPLRLRRVDNSSQCLLKSTSSEQILRIRRAKPKGRFAFWWYGWQLRKFRYWNLSVGLLYKSVWSLPFCKMTLTSRNGTLVVLTLSSLVSKIIP